MALLNDEPTLIDRLDRTSLVKEVGDFVASTSPPQVFGIHGDWGLGKTSFLYQLQWYLTGDCPQQVESEKIKLEETNAIEKGAHAKHVRVVWFEAWRYQYDEVPVVALLQEIRSQLHWSVKIRGQSKKFTEVAVRGALLSLEDLTKKIGIQASKFEAAGEKWERDHLASALPSHTIREHLRQAIDKLLPLKIKDSPTPRLIVLVDDLDRCDSDAAYRLLEGLKIYLTLNNCIFVLGMNQRTIEDAIGKNFPGEDHHIRLRRAAAYLEKLCQNIWRLPTVTDSKNLLIDWMSDESGSEKLEKSINEILGSYQCLPPNPRRIKGFANLMRRLVNRIPAEKWTSEESEILLTVKPIFRKTFKKTI